MYKGKSDKLEMITEFIITIIIIVLVCFYVIKKKKNKNFD